MLRYNDAMGDPQPKPQGYWDTALYLFNTGVSPEDAAAKRSRGQRALGKGGYPFAAKQESYADYSGEQLAFARKDAREAMRAAQRDARFYERTYGSNSPMAIQRREDEGWYADDVHTIVAEIQKREKGSRSARNCACPTPKGRRAPGRAPWIVSMPGATGNTVHTWTGYASNEADARRQARVKFRVKRLRSGTVARLDHHYK